jgi:DNA-binding NtrC family response regulator
MIRVALGSSDLQLQPLLAPALGHDFRVRSEPDSEELRAMIRRACEHPAMKRELDGRQGTPFAGSTTKSLRCDSLIGSSAEMRTVYDLIHRVASLNASVLITGDSGTGKELIARAIHNLGDRSKAPFIAVSCGTPPETLIESELFGHEKGAFTGTTGTRIGYFEQAAQGTIFIDEIGELSLQTQVKPLRVLLIGPPEEPEVDDVA